MRKILSALGFAIFLLIVGFVGTWESNYTLLAVCTSYSFDSRTYEFTDNNGNIWKWEREMDSFVVGGAYRLHMSNNHSSTIYDDYIKKVSKN